MMSHPLITIIFVLESYIHSSGELGTEVKRHWYHVPRLGDEVAVTALFDEDPLIGKVVSVRWFEDYVKVRVR
jgi:hypothetical protein